MAIACAAFSLLVFAGCGSSDDDGGGAAARPVEQVKGKPIKGPKPKETLDEAERRIAKIVASGDCEEINKMSPLSRPDYRTANRCEEFKQLTGLEPSGAAGYPGGAVIDYGSNGRTLRAVLIVDADGYHSIAFVDHTHRGPSGKTKLSPGFDQAANKVVEAFRDQDCEAFRKLTGRRYGVGSARTCSFLEKSQLRVVTRSYAAARAKRLGGNRDYAFYGVANPRSFITVILARQSDADAAPDVSPLPENAPRYGFVNAFRTTPERGDGPG